MGLRSTEAAPRQSGWRGNRALINMKNTALLLRLMSQLLTPATLIGLLATGCAKGEIQTMSASSTSTVGLLLEVVTDPPQGNPTGIRVYTDGRYDYLSDVQIDVAADGTSTTRSVPLDWRTVTTLSASELDELQTAIRSADIPNLQQHYTPTGTVHDAGSQTWKVWLDGTQYEVKVEGYPVTKVPALETLYRRFNELRQLPPSSSNWRVWVDGTIHERNVNCDISGVAKLRPLVHSIFTPQEQPGESPPAQAAPPSISSDTLLVEITWHEQGRPDERTLVYGDGRVLSVMEEQQTVLRTLNAGQLTALIQAGKSIDWDQLPEPVCD